jgi:dynein heavy chain
MFVSLSLQNISRSLSSDHALVFSFILCVGILRGRGDISEEAWSCFLAGGGDDGVSDDVCAETDTRPPFLEEKSWRLLVQADFKLDSFRGISRHFAENADSWKIYCDSSNPQLEEIPGLWNKLR